MIYISPTFLDSFQYYQEADDEYVDIKRRELIDRLKGVTVTSEAMQNGINFENLLCAYLNNKALLDRGDALFPIVDEMSRYLQGSIRQLHVRTQILPNIILHGFIDFLNVGTVYDVKTTGSYIFPKFLHRNQHLTYMAALRSYGINTFKYLITDFKDCFIETYHWRDSIINELRGRVNAFFDYLKIDPEMSEAFFEKAKTDEIKYGEK